MRSVVWNCLSEPLADARSSVLSGFFADLEADEAADNDFVT